jgi:arylformamidase
VTRAGPGRWVELSQPWAEHVLFGPVHGRPGFTRETRWRHQHDAGREVTVTRLSASAHTGTHVDAPRHFYTDGPSIDAYPIDAFVGDGVVLELIRPPGEAVTREQLEAATPSIERGDIVFLRLGFGERFGEDAYLDHPHLTGDAAQALVDRGVRMVGVDTLTPDLAQVRRTPGFDYPVHRRLLGAGVLIVENLGPALREVAGTRTTLGAVPLRLPGSDAGPAFAFALVAPEGAA